MNACFLATDQITRTICIIYAAWLFFKLFYLNMSLFGDGKYVAFICFFFLSLFFFFFFPPQHTFSFLNCFISGQIGIFKNLIFNL